MGYKIRNTKHNFAVIISLHEMEQVEYSLDHNERELLICQYG